MSHDKYSDDHIISIKKGEGKLLIEGDLEFTGALDVSPISLKNDIYHRIRIPGIAFRPSTYDSLDIMYNVDTGALIFDSTQVFVHAEIPNLPHGATIHAIRLVASAVTSSDTITVSLRESDGTTSTALASILATNEGFNVDKQSDLTPGPKQIDYTENKMYFIKAVGQKAGVAADLKYVDVIYSIDKLLLNSETSFKDGYNSF